MFCESVTCYRTYNSTSWKVKEAGNCERRRLVLTGVVVRRDGCTRGHVLDEDGAGPAVLCERLFQVEAPLVPSSFGRHFQNIFFSFLCTSIYGDV